MTTEALNSSPEIYYVCPHHPASSRNKKHCALCGDYVKPPEKHSLFERLKLWVFGEDYRL